MEEHHEGSWTSLRLRSGVKGQLAEFCETEGVSQGVGIQALLDFYHKHKEGGVAL